MAKLTDVAAAIEKRTQAKLARGVVTLELPVYDGQYAGRFGVLPPEVQDEFERLAESPDVDHEKALDVACGLIADACRVILARSEDGEWEPLEHEDGRPVGFDEDFAKALGLERADGKPIMSAADVVLAVWTTAEGDVATVALNGFAIRLVQWMTDTRAPVEGEVVEGSHGGRK